MQAEITKNAQGPDNRTEKLKEKRDRFTWWQAALILVGTLVVSLVAGYLICSNFVWNQGNDELVKQLNYYKAQVDKKPNDANLRIQLGYSYFLNGNNEDAIKQYDTAKSLDNKNYSAYLNLAIVYDKENNNDLALQNAIKASKLAENDYKSSLLMGREYRKLKIYKKASDALDDAIRFKPGNIDTLYEIGLVAEDQGKKSQAEKIYKEALSYDPTYKPALKALNRLEGKK